MNESELKEFLDFKVNQYENSAFISSDPIQIPHLFTRKEDIEIIGIGSQIFAVCSIGLNKNGEKTHIHMWIYNLHSFNKDYRAFCTELTKKLKGLKGISKRNEFSVKLVPCTDPIDRLIRQSNYNKQVIIDYIRDREYNTLMNYFATKNDKNFIYFY